MGIERKLNQEQERQVTISYLCGVKTSYIQKQFGVSDATTRMNIVRKRSPEWNDSLVEFYRQTDSRDRLRNAIHLYLTFYGQSDILPNADLIDKERDKPAYEAVDGNIFDPKTYNLITRTTRLERIMETSIKDLSPEQKLLQAVFRDCTIGYGKALKLVEPLLYQRLREAYQQDKKINIDVIYAQVANEIFRKLRRGLYLAENPQIEEYARKLEEAEKLRFKEFLATLAPREQQILKQRFGFEDDKTSLEEVAQKFAVTRDRIRQIERKALMKLNHPSRLKLLNDTKNPR